MSDIVEVGWVVGWLGGLEVGDKKGRHLEAGREGFLLYRKTLIAFMNFNVGGPPGSSLQQKAC